MAKKKQPNIADIVDGLMGSSSPISNGHDAEGMADAEESGELDEMMEETTPRRKRSAKTQTRAEVAAEAETEEALAERPARRRRAPRRTADDAEGDDAKQLKLPLVPLRDMVIFPHMVTSL